MAQELTALFAPVENPGWFPAPTRWLTAVANSSSRKYRALFWSLWTLGIHVKYVKYT